MSDEPQIDYCTHCHREHEVVRGKCPPPSSLPSSTGSGIRVKFQNVGGGKMCWEATLPDLEYRTLCKEMRKRGALCSRHPEFGVDDDGTGTIFAGFRCVGTFEWQND